MLRVELCEHCGDEEVTGDCNDCNNGICGEHSHKCETCKQNFCPNCIHKCEECGGYVCNYCIVGCLICMEHSLHEACAYKIGEDWYCEKHTEKCNICNNRMHTDDITVCAKCEERICSEHRVQIDTDIFCNDCAKEMKKEAALKQAKRLKEIWPLVEGMDLIDELIKDIENS